MGLGPDPYSMYGGMLYAGYRAKRWLRANSSYYRAYDSLPVTAYQWAKRQYKKVGTGPGGKRRPPYRPDDRKKKRRRSRSPRPPFQPDRSPRRRKEIVIERNNQPTCGSGTRVVSIH